MSMSPREKMHNPLSINVGCTEWLPSEEHGVEWDKKSNSTVEEPGKYHFKQVIKMDIINTKKCP